MNRRVCSCGKWELTKIPCKHVVAAIYNMFENSVGVGIPKQWVHAAYRLETWAHVYSFKIASQSTSSRKISRKGKSVSCGKYSNVGHNRKGCRGQGGGSSQAGARKVSGQAAGSRNVSGQAAGARNVSGQAAGSRKASSQPIATQSTTNQGLRQGFQDQ
ncbi:mutator type transposase [Tanacetum coccineum]